MYQKVKTLLEWVIKKIKQCKAVRKNASQSCCDVNTNICKGNG